MQLADIQGGSQKLLIDKKRIYYISPIVFFLDHPV